MARDLDFPVRTEVLPTVREADGLAMSSRNAYLDEDARERAVALSRALRAAEQGVRENSLQAGLHAPPPGAGGAGLQPGYPGAGDPGRRGAAGHPDGPPRPARGGGPGPRR